MIQDLAMAAIGLGVATGLAAIAVIVQWLAAPPCQGNCASCAIERMDRTVAPADVVKR